MKLISTFLFTFLFFPLFIHAQLGVLDNSFSGNGIQEISMGKSTSINTIPILLSNGDYISAGAFIINGTYFKLLSKYKANGTLDISFGNNGYAFDITDTLYTTPLISTLQQSDGKFLVASTTQSNFNTFMSIHRYLPNGVLDISYGVNGKVKLSSNSNTQFCGFSIQNNDKVVAVSYRNYDTTFLHRLNTNGTPDSTFATNGTSKIKTPYIQSFASLVSLQSGKYVVANPQGSAGSIFIQYTNAGIVDSTFGINGQSKIDSADVVNSVVELSNNKILISSKNKIIRLLPNGFIDSTFGTNGIYNLPTSFATGGNIFPLSSGNFLVNNLGALNICKCLEHGGLDATFGTNGIKTLLGFSGVTRSILFNNATSCIITGQCYIPSNYTPSAFIGRIDTNANWDLSFNNNGYFCNPMGYSSDYLTSMVVLNDNSIIGFGPTSNPVASGWPFITNATYSYFLKLQSNGNMDNTFGVNGINRDTNNFAGAYYLLPLSNGKLLAPGDEAGLQLTQYKINGDRDSSFGTNGIVKTSITNYSTTYTPSIDADANGNIFRAINSYQNLKYNASVFKYNSNGTTAISFGTNGFASIQMDSAKRYTIALQDVKVQNDGKIIVGGFADTTGNNLYKKRRLAFARFNADGTPDISFGKNGASVIPAVLNDSNLCWRFKLQSTGKIIAVGYIHSKELKDVLVIRLNTDGSLDNTFGFNGSFIADINGNEDEANDLAILSDDKIVVAGNSKNSIGNYDQFILKLNANGTTDNSFGTNGLFTYSVGTNGYENSTKIAISKDEQSVFVGGYYQANYADYDIFIAKVILNYALGTIEFNTQNSQTLLLYPNPVVAQSSFEYELAKEENVSIHIMDMQGKIVKTIVQNYLQQKGKHTIQLQLEEQMPKGNYLLLLTNGKGNQLVKFTKQ